MYYKCDCERTSNYASRKNCQRRNDFHSASYQAYVWFTCGKLNIYCTNLNPSPPDPKFNQNIQERNKKDMFDPVVGQIMRIYGYFVMKKLGSQKHLVLAFFLCFEHNWVLWRPVGGTWIASHAANWIIDVSIGSQTNSTKDFGGYPEILRRRQTKLVIKNRHLTWCYLYCGGKALLGVLFFIWNCNQQLMTFRLEMK